MINPDQPFFVPRLSKGEDTTELTSCGGGSRPVAKRERDRSGKGRCDAFKCRDDDVLDVAESKV